MNGTAALAFLLSSFSPSAVRFMTPWKRFYKEIFCVWIMYDSSSHCIVRFEQNLTRLTLLTVTMIIAKVRQYDLQSDCSYCLPSMTIPLYEVCPGNRPLHLSLAIQTFSSSSSSCYSSFHPHFPSWSFGQRDLFLTCSSHLDPVFLLGLPFLFRNPSLLWDTICVRS